MRIRRFNESISVEPIGATLKRGDEVICSDYGIGYVVTMNSGIRKYPITVTLNFTRSFNQITLFDGRSVEDTDITLTKANHGWKGSGR